MEKRSRGPKQVGDREIIVCNDHYIAVVCRSAAGDVSLSLTLISNKLNSCIIVYISSMKHIKYLAAILHRGAKNKAIWT